MVAPYSGMVVHFFLAKKYGWLYIRVWSFIFFDRILVISTDFCYFPKMLRRFLKMREKVGMLAVQKCRRHAGFKSDHGRLFFFRPFPPRRIIG